MDWLFFGMTGGHSFLSLLNRTVFKCSSKIFTSNVGNRVTLAASPCWASLKHYILGEQLFRLKQEFQDFSLSSIFFFFCSAHNIDLFSSLNKKDTAQLLQPNFISTLFSTDNFCKACGAMCIKNRKPHHASQLCQTPLPRGVNTVLMAHVKFTFP